MVIKGGDMVAASDKLLEAVLAAPSPWSKHRYWAFENALFWRRDAKTGKSLGAERHILTLLHDQFVDNEDEPVHFRAKAAKYVATIKYVIRRQDLQSAANLLRFALGFLDEADQNNSPEDNIRTVYFEPYIPDEEDRHDRRKRC